MLGQRPGESQAARPRSLTRGLWARLSGVWQRLHAGGLGTALHSLFEGLRFAGGQGQLFSPRVVALDPRLVRPLRAAGCQVQLEEPQPGASDAGGRAEQVDALCLRPQRSVSPEELSGLATRVREGGLVVVCSPLGRTGTARRPQRSQLAAALLHAGLMDVVQLVAGPYVVTAGQVPRRI